MQYLVAPVPCHFFSGPSGASDQPLHRILCSLAPVTSLVTQNLHSKHLPLCSPTQQVTPGNLKAHGALFATQAVFALWYIVGHAVLTDNDPLTFALVRELMSAGTLLWLAKTLEGEVRVKSKEDLVDITAIVRPLRLCCCAAAVPLLPSYVPCACRCCQPCASAAVPLLPSCVPCASAAQPLPCSPSHTSRSPAVRLSCAPSHPSPPPAAVPLPWCHPATVRSQAAAAVCRTGKGVCAACIPSL